MKVFLVISALLLSGCGTLLGINESELDTANKRLAAAGLQIESLANLTNNLLQIDAITTEQAQIVSTNLRSALNAVQAAKDAVETSGDPAQADTALEIVERSLEISLNLLNGFSGNNARERISHYDSSFTRRCYGPQRFACYSARV